MRALRKMSLQRKQMLIILLTSTVSLLLACAIFVVYDVISFRKSLIEKVSVVAQAVGDNCTAAIEYNDQQTADETLGAMRAEPSIVGACIFTRQGTVFAIYSRGGGRSTFSPPPVKSAGYEFKGRDLHLYRSIRQRGEVMGTLFVLSDSSELNERLARYPGVVGGMFLAAFLVAFILSARLQRVISGPILHLASVARAVALDRNYSVRATKRTDDELGQLIEGFNEMLTQIQERDRALQAARDELEHRVEERTEELRQSQALYHSLVEHLPLHVYRKDERGKFVFVNSHFCQFHALKAEQILGKTILEITGQKAAEFDVKDDESILSTGEPIEREEEHQDKSNGSRHFQIIKSPVFSSDGKVVGIQGVSFDITERKLAEAKLQEVNRELVRASRHAGMAEVATSVLHNVGNVLNSVNVSASMMLDRLKQSRIPNFVRVVAMIRQHTNDLGQFITVDPKGRQIPDYLENLATLLSQEQTSFTNEMQGLIKHVDHIKNIVVMQQSYAKVAGVSETVNIPELVEDALRIDASELERHRIEINRQYDTEVPGISVDKHRLLQILVNLVRNARHACNDSAADQKAITVQVRSTALRVSITVADNGVGIPPENLTRIFQHGFTTRRSGHGFGLHSGALAAKEMGGTLAVHSDGPGKGASFTLELPRGHKPAPQQGRAQSSGS